MPASSDWTVMDPALETLLKTQPALWRGRDQQQHDHHAATTSFAKTGFKRLDSALPGGGWTPGTLTELLVEYTGIGEFSLLLPALRTITQQQQWIALVHPPYVPYAPALANAGIRLDKILIVDADNDKDTLWSTEQLLRAGCFSAVICWVDKSSPRQQRRLQLAAETGRSWAVTYRPASAVKESSPAALRIALSVLDGTLILDILKARGGATSSVVIGAQDFDAPQGVEWPARDTADLTLTHPDNTEND